MGFNGVLVGFNQKNGGSNGFYHLVMTNSSPWKIPKINGGFDRWRNFHGYVRNNYRGYQLMIFGAQPTDDGVHIQLPIHG